MADRQNEAGSFEERSIVTNNPLVNSLGSALAAQEGRRVTGPLRYAHNSIAAY